MRKVARKVEAEDPAGRRGESQGYWLAGPGVCTWVGFVSSPRIAKAIVLPLFTQFQSSFVGIVDSGFPCWFSVVTVIVFVRGM